MLLGAGVPLRALAGPVKSLDRIVGELPGAALLVDVANGHLIASYRPDRAAALPLAPGSVLKPFTLQALLAAGKLIAEEAFPCPRDLMIGGRSFTCSHPSVGTPMRVRTALAYSCNCYVAHFAQRFEPGELGGHLLRAGLISRSGWFGESEGVGQIRRAESREAQQLQAIGEGSVTITTAGLALAYRRLALNAARPEMEPIRSGLEDAVRFGTGQLARLEGIQVAGKTGSVRDAGGAMIAWFAGFAPSQAPAVAVAVMLQGRSGGADAAPIAGRILEAHWAGRL